MPSSRHLIHTTPVTCLWEHVKGSFSSVFTGLLCFLKLDCLTEKIRTWIVGILEYNTCSHCVKFEKHGKHVDYRHRDSPWYVLYLYAMEYSIELKYVRLSS